MLSERKTKSNEQANHQSQREIISSRLMSKKAWKSSNERSLYAVIYGGMQDVLNGFALI